MSASELSTPSTEGPDQDDYVGGEKFAAVDSWFLNHDVSTQIL